MIKCVVPVSGGKDSQCCLKLAIKRFSKNEVLGLFCDTKFEHPETYLHIENMKKMYGVRIESINAGDVISKCILRRRFPSGVARFCTNELKIIPTKKYLTQLAKDQAKGFEVWYGMRQDESNERSVRYNNVVSEEVYAPHEIMRNYPKYLNKLGVVFKLPIVNWTSEDVFKYLENEHNPLYNKGFNRVGCFPCLAGGDKSKIKAFNYDDTGKKHYLDVKIVEEKINKSVFTSKKYKGNILDEDENNQGCLICSI